MAKGNGDRVAIVTGVRTPFAKQGTAFKRLSALDLGKLAVAELLSRTALKASEVDQVVYGQVIPSVTVPNIAREIVLGVDLPRSIEAYSVSRACTTSYQSTVSVAEAIMAGVIDVGIAGGADSASDIPMVTSKPLSDALLGASRARGVGGKLSSFRGVHARDLVPIPPALKEPSTGLTMGESAEKMAKENGISRQAQDEFAHRSHTLAAQAWADGRLARDVMTAYLPPKFEAFSEDNIVRKDSTLDAYSKLKPVFDRKFGTITAGNSSPLTDGASALLVMRESKAKSLGYEPLGFIRSYAFTAVDPSEQLLMAPAYAAPLALDRAELKLKNMDLVDLHEAFAAQVLSNTQAFESDTFAREKLGRDKKLGTLDWERVNVLGGSIALGHPFAATGARQILHTLRELRRRGGEFALCTACAAGGLGAAMVLEAA
ncbi:MAG TPA: acetyl-CoA C-acyltransferase FadI [Polyangiaceae bacterium]|nr:acetyl-CoA C-acyltransferase FadI [Polyangiaceae bacterium]